MGKGKLDELTTYRPERIFELARQLEERTGLETRVTILGYLQRGGKPSCFDRLLASQLGTAAAQAVIQRKFGNMVSFAQGKTKLVPIEEVAGIRKTVTPDHPWVASARELGMSFGE